MSARKVCDSVHAESAGAPLQASETVAAKPLSSVTVSVYVTLLPGVTVWAAGPAESAKSMTFCEKLAEMLPS